MTHRIRVEAAGRADAGRGRASGTVCCCPAVVGGRADCGRARRGLAGGALTASIDFWYAAAWAFCLRSRPDALSFSAFRALAVAVHEDAREDAREEPRGVLASASKFTDLRIRSCRVACSELECIRIHSQLWRHKLEGRWVRWMRWQQSGGSSAHRFAGVPAHPWYTPWLGRGSLHGTVSLRKEFTANGQPRWRLPLLLALLKS